MIVQKYIHGDVMKITFPRFFATIENIGAFNLLTKGAATLAEEIEIQRINEGAGHDSLYAKV